MNSRGLSPALAVLIGGLGPSLAWAQTAAVPAPNERSKPEMNISDDVMKALQKSMSSSTSTSTTSAPAAPSAKSVGKIAASGRGSASMAMPLVRLQMLYTQVTSPTDVRTALSPSLGAGSTAANSQLQIAQFLPTLTFRAFQDGDLRADFEAKLPVRTVRQGSSALAKGSEFGGVEPAFLITTGHVQLRAAFAARRSSVLNLQDPINEVNGSVALLQNERSSRENLDVQARLEALGRTPVGGPGPGIGGVTVEYGPAWGVRTQAGFTFNFGTGALIRLGSEAFFLRAQSFRSGGFDTGGAGLLAVSPYLEYGLTPDIALGVRYDIAASRPTGREYVFGDPGLAGLYGSGLGVNLRVSTF